MKRTLADLQGVDVVDEDGARLGPLQELRCRSTRGRAGPAARVETLVVGARGWLERLGVARSRGGEIDARAIVRWERDVVVVRRGTRVQRRPEEIFTRNSCRIERARRRDARVASHGRWASLRDGTSIASRHAVPRARSSEASMSSKSKRSTPTKEMLRDVARTMQRRAAEPSLSFVVGLPTPGNRRDPGAFDDRVAWSRASARARRRGLH